MKVWLGITLCLMLLFSYALYPSYAQADMMWLAFGQSTSGDTGNGLNGSKTGEENDNANNGSSPSQTESQQGPAPGGSSPNPDSSTNTNNTPNPDSSTDTDNNPSTDSSTNTNNNPSTDNSTNTNNNPSTNNSTNTNNNPSTDSGPAPGGTIINQYEPDAYIQEKTVEEQQIEDAILQYYSPRLNSLSLGQLALIPIFSSETFFYTAYLPEGQNSVSVSAWTSSGTVYINGRAGGSAVISCGGEQTTLRVIVSDQGQSTTYTIQLLRAPLLQQTPEDAYIMQIQISNDDFYFEREISEADGSDIAIKLPVSYSKKKYYVSVKVNRETLVYYNNVRAYNGYFHQDSGAWTWIRELKEIGPGGALLGVHLVDLETRADLNYYSFTISREGALHIQLQVDNEEVLLNGQLYLLEAPPRIVEGYTVVPLRFIAEALGAEVEWQPEQQRISLRLDGSTLDMFIGQQSEGLPIAPFIENGRTMVPLRYISEQLDCQVEWLGDTREIIIYR